MNSSASDQTTIHIPSGVEDQSITITLDSTPVLTWLAQMRRAGQPDRTILRRGVIARLIWQACGQRSPGLIDNVAYVLGHRIWGDEPRTTLAADLWILRRALAEAGWRLRYDNGPRYKGLYIQGRPPLDPQIVRAIRGAIAEVDPEQMAIIRQHTPAERFAQAVSMIEFVQRAGALRLRRRQPNLSETEALYLIRQRRFN